MPKLIITCGCSGSGKSTYAKELVKNGWIELNRDAWRFTFFCEGKEDWNLYKFSKEREAKVTRHLENLWELNSGGCSASFYQRNIVVSNTNLNEKDHDYWRSKAEQAGYEFEVVYFDVLLEDLLKRDQKRGALSVGREVLFEQWKKWLKITDFKTYTPNEYKEKAVILDIDGTIALTNGRSFYDYSDKVSTDKPRLDVITLVECWTHYTTAHIIIVSGREEVCKEATELWLQRWCVDYTSIHMRKLGDNRSDRLVKQDIFWNDIADSYNVVAAFDDRPRITRLWKDIGIPLVVDVSKSYMEF